IGGQNGVRIQGANGSIDNTGTITGSGGIAAYLSGGGVVSNSAPTARIAGHVDGVAIGGASGSVTNAGTITGATNAGVLLNSGGSLSNLAGGYIAGQSYGVTTR